MPRLNELSLKDFPDVEAALDRRLDPDLQAPLALALSGGGDSMALLHLAQGWARRNGRRLLALTVDHGLHADSAAWTAFAGDAATMAGADWRALHWLGPKPANGLPAAARLARHKRLADAARAAGASVILFAHTRDDIVEADMMRTDTPTLGHLREWSPPPVWPEGRGVFVLRPLLGIRRAALRDYLHAKSRSWLDDPANDDPRFARARARRFLEGQTVDAEPPFTSREDDALTALSQAARHTLDGRIEVSHSDLMGADADALKRLLSIAVVCAAGASSPPRGDRLARLVETVRSGAAFIATLAGARITSDGAVVSFAREAGELVRQRPATLDLQTGERAVWDERFEIAADAPVNVSALAGKAAHLSKGERASLCAFTPTARPAFPALLQGGQVHLPRPFGEGPAHAHALAPARFAAACGLITHECDIWHPGAAQGMAQARRSSYVGALALA